jgi:UV DNA damage endonuclease
MMDYSSQAEGKKKGSHTSSIDMNHFATFIDEIKGIDCDIMLEIKDKEKSALKAIDYLEKLNLSR